jgi:hypothetical protein
MPTPFKNIAKNVTTNPQKYIPTMDHFYNYGPFILLVIILSVMGVSGMAGCYLSWEDILPTFGMRGRVYVMG